MNTNELSTSTPQGWLAAFSARSLGDFEMTPDLDLLFSQFALFARRDVVSRDHLLTMLSYKIARFCARYQRRNLAPWSIDDVHQEAFLAFDDVLASWPPLASHDGPAGFGYYFLRVFPLRLAGRVRALFRPEAVAVAAADGPPDQPDPIEIEGTVLANQIIAEICGQLNGLDQKIFLLSAREAQTVSRIAKLTGISRRTVRRHWPAIVSIARERLREAI